MKTILIFASGSTAIQTLPFVLREAGFHVSGTSNYHEVLQFISSYPFDLIIFDYDSLETGSLDLFSEIRSRYGDIPIVLLVTHATLPAVIDAFRHGVSDFLIKPVESERIIERINILNEKKRRGQRRQQITDQIISLINELNEIESNAQQLDHPSLTPEPSILETNTILQKGPFQVYLDARQVILNGQPVKLAPMSFNYLIALLRRSPSPISYEELVCEIHGYNLKRSEARDIARWQIYQLRQGLETDPRHPCYILTERGIGYRLVIPLCD